MNSKLHETVPQPSIRPVEIDVPNPSLLELLGCLLTRRRARRLKRSHREHDQRFAWFVEDVLAGCGLVEEDYSIGGGRIAHVPQVLSVADGPPRSVVVKILPGQMPEDFAAKARAIAYDLGVTDVRVVPLEPCLIQLDLLP